MNKKITREIFLYVLFGALTTLINVLAYSLSYYTLYFSNTVATVVSWILSVVFAYITSRAWVFESKSNNAFKEVAEFFLCRITTGALDLLIMYVGVELLFFEGVWIKVLSNICVVILNYLASRLYIFKKH